MTEGCKDRGLTFEDVAFEEYGGKRQVMFKELGSRADIVRMTEDGPEIIECKSVYPFPPNCYDSRAVAYRLKYQFAKMPKAKRRVVFEDLGFDDDQMEDMAYEVWRVVGKDVVVEFLGR